MKLALLAGLALAALPGVAQAGEKIEGQAQCGKCALKKSDSCHAVVVVKKDGAETVYWAEKDDKGKELHAEICTSVKPAVVEGTVSEKDGKKMVKITKFELK
jgi:hypothetical protein